MEADRGRRAANSEGFAAGGQAGFTVIELMTAMTTMVTVLLATMLMIDFALKNEPEIAERNAAIQEAQVEMERLAQELRQSYDVLAASPSSLSVLTYLNRTACGAGATGTARKCRVDYSCASGDCTRTESEPDGSMAGPVRTIVTGLGSDSVFAYQPDVSDPSAIDVTMSFEAPEGSGEDAITLHDGVSLRNIALVGASS